MTSAHHAVDGDFDGFYRAHFRDTVAIAYGQTGDMAAAQDVAQEAFMRAWQRWRQISAYDNPVYWVRRVAENLAHSRWRRAKVAAAYLVRQRQHEVPDLSPESVDLLNALKRLPAAQRKAIVLHYFLDLPVDQVAKEMAVPAGTVKSWLSRGRSHLADTLRQEIDQQVKPELAVNIRVAAGRRQARRRAAATGAIAAFVVVALISVLQLGGFGKSPEPPATPSPSPSVVAAARQFGTLVESCAIAPLAGPPGFDESYVAAGQGRFLAGLAVSGTGESRLVLWKDNKLTAALPAPHGKFRVTGVSADGVLVGNGAAAWAVAGTRMVQLEGVDTVVHGIGRDGMIAGSERGKPVVWPSYQEAYHPLALPTGTSFGYAVGVTGQGAIVGVVSDRPVTDSSSNVRSIVWYRDGTVRDLIAPEHPGADVRILLVNNESALGLVGTAGSETRQIRWRVPTLHTEEIPARAESIDELGDPAGYGLVTTSGNTIGIPLQLPDGDRIRDPHTPYFGMGTQSESENKRVAGWGVSERTGKPIAVQWSCTTGYHVSPPASLAPTASLKPKEPA